MSIPHSNENGQPFVDPKLLNKMKPLEQARAVLRAALEREQRRRGSVSAAQFGAMGKAIEVYSRH